MNRLSLAQQIAQLEEATPVDFDPEDVHITGAHSDGEDLTPDLSLAREHYLDVGQSALRKLQDSIADPKYDGVPTSRKKLMEDSDIDSGADTEDVRGEHESDGTPERDVPEEVVPQVVPGEEDGSESESSKSESSQSESEPPHAPYLSQSPGEVDPLEDLSSTLRKTREEDLLKGKAVSRQIAIWDSLLDARIRLQKSVAGANRFPLPSDVSKFATSAECRDSLSKMLEAATSLSDELFTLQESLLVSNWSIQPPPRKKRRMQDDPDHEACVLDACEAASALENSFHPYLLQTLSKWSYKIQAVAPSVLLPSNRNAFSKTSQHHLKSAVQLVDETLADHEKILKRTWVRRGKGARVGTHDASNGGDEGEVVDVEVFDDTDFYQQLLRDVIDARGNAGGGDNWMVTQKQKKAKKKVDTKASKGRKLRYEVHEKLQNFMVPVPVQDGWHEEQIDELFASLLGKGFESGVGIEEPEERKELQKALNGGFKVFG